MRMKLILLFLLLLAVSVSAIDDVTPSDPNNTTNPSLQSNQYAALQAQISSLGKKLDEMQSNFMTADDFHTLAGEIKSVLASSSFEIVAKLLTILIVFEIFRIALEIYLKIKRVIP